MNKTGIMLMLIYSSCCIETDYKKHFDKFEGAASILTENKVALSAYEKKFNKSGTDGFIFSVGSSEFSEIVKLEANKELESILSLWEENLINDDEESLWLLKNGNIYFQLDKCRNGYNYLVYDGGEEIELDVSDSLIKERIKPNWIYIRMR